jgi:hypothetical protein
MGAAVMGAAVMGAAVMGAAVIGAAMIGLAVAIRLGSMSCASILLQLLGRRPGSACP